MNKRLLTTIATHVVRGVFVLALFLIAINLIRLAHGQPQSNNTWQTNSQTSRNLFGNNNGAKTVVRVHDTVERPQIALRRVIFVA
jgi:hypothetical protein